MSEDLHQLIRDLELQIEQLRPNGATILLPDALERNRENTMRLAVLGRQLTEARAKLPPTGAAAGTITIGDTLGDVTFGIPFDDVPDPRDEHADDPMWKFAREQGWSLE